MICRMVVMMIGRRWKMSEILLSGHGKHRHIELNASGNIRQIVDWGDENE